MSNPGSQRALFIGLMSGTSMDGIDAALVRLGNRTCDLVDAESCPYPDLLRQELQDIVRDPQRCTVDDIGRLDRWVGECFRDAVLALLKKSATVASTVRAIGSHGQTIRHQPHSARPFTMQIGDPNVIAAGTGIDTVADFRRRDMAVGGEGAPLAVAFHHWLFSDKNIARVVLNIGGIANITVLSVDGHTTGFDTGPGNTLLDGWIRHHAGKPFDGEGAWAASGSCSKPLLDGLLADPYFAQPPPKSTGPEYFNLDWLLAASKLSASLAPQDVQATLSELTACSVANAIRRYAPDTAELLICGGGAKNAHLVDTINRRLPDVPGRTTGDFGVGADWVESAAFAWLASQYLDRNPGNLTAVTGASRAAVLGGLYLGSP